MTLHRRMLIGILCIFALAAAGVEAIYVASARASLQDQLASHSQDTATALGLLLATALGKKDAVLAETIVGAVFDRGYYREIRVSDAAGETLVLRRQPATPPDVPNWFPALVPLDAPATESLITAGWHNAGRVSVSSHPNFAYQQLWHTTRASLAWLIALLGLGSVMAVLFLRTITRPLREVERAAQAIAAGRFVTIDTRPAAPELRRVVETINTLSASVRRMAEQDVRKVEK